MAGREAIAHTMPTYDARNPLVPQRAGNVEAACGTGADWPVAVVVGAAAPCSRSRGRSRSTGWTRLDRTRLCLEQLRATVGPMGPSRRYRQHPGPESRPCRRGGGHRHATFVACHTHRSTSGAAGHPLRRGRAWGRVASDLRSRCTRHRHGRRLFVRGRSSSPSAFVGPPDNMKNGHSVAAQTGAEDGTRTRDFRLGKPTFYQLNYFRDACIITNGPPVVKRPLNTTGRP
jgi:hypothetical protein